MEGFWASSNPWIEWFSIGMLLVTVGLPVAYLALGFFRHHMDDPDCSKFNFFTVDPNQSVEEQTAEQPNVPVRCRPRHMGRRPWFASVNTAWIWVTLAIGATWFVLMLGAYIISFQFPEMRQSAPV